MWIVYICLIGILGFGVWQCWICRVPFFFVHDGEQQRVRGRGIGLGRCSGDAF